jgi:hypothetical protein
MAADRQRLRVVSPQDTIGATVGPKRTSGQTRLRASRVRRGKNGAEMVDALAIRKVASCFRRMSATLRELEKLNLLNHFTSFPTVAAIRPRSFSGGIYA